MGKLSIPLTIGQISRRENFHVVNAPLPFGILSINSLHKFRLTIDFNKCTIFQLGAPLSTPSYHFNKVPNVCTHNDKHAQNAPTQRDNSHTKHIGDHTPSHNYHMTKPHNELDTPIDTQQNPLPHACYNTTSNTHYTPQFTTLLQRYTHIFTQNKFNVPCLRIPPVKIPTNSEKIITIRPYRVPICDQQEIRHQIQQMLENGIIEQSFSPFSSPVTLVTKRDKTKRFCIDYRKVNELISSDVHPLPRIEDILDRLAQAKYFSTADISSAYWQVPIHPDSRPLLAFATLEGLYQPTRLPFGLKTSPQIYERAISQVLQRHGLDCVAHYFDDFIIYSNTLEEHQNHLRQFFAFCEAEKLQLNFVKCEFFKQSIDFLGYTITAGTITPLTRNTDIIHAIKQPHNRKTLQSFLGAVNVYNKFIPEYARLRTPLNNLLKKDVVWNWNEVCQKAFIDLKGNLTQHPILHLYKEGLPCQVYCDASTLGIAGILKQVHPDGNVYPVQYFIRTLRPHEKNYSISELECLAIVESVEKFRIYLMGRKFTIFSDHHALQWLKTIKNPSGRLFRWSLRLSSYEYEVRYIKGKLQYEADLLSRNPFCGFLDTTLIKTHQPPPSKESSLTIDRNGLHTVSRKGVTKIIIPKPLIQQLLQTVHTQYNHPGISQMSRIISTQYYWQGMSKDIKQKVKTCPTCQLTKRPLGPTYGELSQPPEAKEPFDLLSLDTIAGFAKYGNTKIYLHVVVDHFSRYAWTFPSKSTSTITYQQVLKRVLQDGSPKRLLTDRAPAFTSPKFRSFLLNRNIHPLLTTSNNPQANGLCERLNATLTGKLRLLHLENPKIAWTKLVKRVTIIYNKTPHSTTGFPPIYLMFGILPPELSDHSTPYPDIDKARKIAHTRTQNKHLQDKNIYDQRHKQPHFEVGDLVLVKLYHHPNTGKLAPYFTGPHTILEIISPNVVRIDRPNQPLQRDTDTIHVILSTRSGFWLNPRLSIFGQPYDLIVLTRAMNVFFNILPFSITNFIMEYFLNFWFDHETFGIKPKRRLLASNPVVSGILPECISKGTIHIKGNIKKFTERGIIFENEDTEIPVDDVILGTGYRIHFPFLDFKFEDKIDLYKMVFSPDDPHPTLAFIGLIQTIGPGVPCGEMQVRWATRVLSGKSTLPSCREMREETDERMRITREYFGKKQRVEKLNRRIQQLEKTMENTVKSVSKNSERIQEIEKRIEFTEMKMSESNLIFYGVEKKENETRDDSLAKIKR
ncbi:hypothetical protein LAZ67_7001199 [Cordylochernes scorpioides]|uniref:Flavin-containing monooxygenase n=1 Tax=Cordylochernes scorpioides TaxID=51811 RepID=A0ABY6KQN8_9ARAC|nr:hypothetical protein LAZ67_7001199 [Cordylochernes scorpioides]